MPKIIGRRERRRFSFGIGGGAAGSAARFAIRSTPCAPALGRSNCVTLFDISPLMTERFGSIDVVAQRRYVNAD
jgi:hypothetical protein